MIEIKRKVHFRHGRRSRKAIEVGEAAPEVPVGRVPHVSRLIALAIRLDQLLREGAVTDQAELARIGHVPRARLTQLMDLLCLAPDIQEQVLFLLPTQRGGAAVTERDLRPIAAEVEWGMQRGMWRCVQFD